LAKNSLLLDIEIEYNKIMSKVIQYERNFLKNRRRDVLVKMLEKEIHA